MIITEGGGVEEGGGEQLSQKAELPPEAANRCPHRIERERANRCPHTVSGGVAASEKDMIFAAQGGEQMSTQN